MSSTLYILGNGFDLFHGLPTGMSDFRAFVEREDPEVFDNVVQFLFAAGENWTHLEEALGSADEDSIIDSASPSLVPYGSDDWSDAHHHEYPDTIGEIVGSLSSGLKSLLFKWIKEVESDAATRATQALLEIEPEARFISFNYTATVSRIYGVREDQVWHIHGSLVEGQQSFVFGHASPRGQSNPRKAAGRNEGHEGDPRELEGQFHINRYFQTTLKPSESIIRSRAAEFDRHSDVERIFVWGHSLSEIDECYFKHIAACAPKAHWLVSFYSDAERSAHEKTLLSFGLLPSRFSLQPLTAWKRA